ncbi:hypothetical protein J26TS2_24790 [Shouchella clausii]|nr:hypothetical protein J26TS2_24790 [Shouchella clausii]
MRRLIAFLLLLVYVIGLYSGSGFIEQWKFNQLLYNDRHAVTLNFAHYEEDANALLQTVVDDYDVSFAKYVYVESDYVRIFATDVTLGGRVHLKEGRFPTASADQFVTNRIGNERKAATGEFQSGERNVELEIYPLAAQKQASESGLYYIESPNKQTLIDMLTFLEQQKVTHDVLEFQAEPPIIEDPVSFLLPQLIILLTVLGVIAFDLIHRSHKAALMKVHGYSYKRTVWILSQTLVSITLVAAFGGFVVFGGLKALLGQPLLNLSLLISVYVLYIAFVLLVLLVFSAFLVGSIYFFGRTYEYLKGKRLYGGLMALSFAMKLGFLLLVLFFVDEMEQTNQSLQEYNQDFEIWEQTKQLYRPRLMTAGRVDLATEDEQNQRLQAVYEQLNETVNGFVINAENFEVSTGGEYYYELASGNPLTVPDGKAIVINENYLRYNPIEAETATIAEQIVYNDTTLNLLVPVSLKSYEEEIKQNFLEHFYFQKVEVGNFYNEEKREPLDETPISDLDVSLIYVKDNQTYFTFAPDFMGGGEYEVKDPIVVVDTGVFDASYYMSYLSSSYYFFSEEENPLVQLEQIAAGHGVSAQLNSVESIYDFYGEQIQALKTAQYLLLLVTVLLAIGAFTVSMYYTICFFYKHKVKIVLKTIQGYSFWRTNMPLFIWQSSIYLALFAGVLWLQSTLVMFVILGVFVLDALATFLLTRLYSTNRYISLKKEASL